MNLMQQT